jgi:hypothetical protein
MPAGKINLSPQVLDLTLYAGDDAEFRLICKDPDGEPVDISGGVEAQVRLDRSQGSTVLAEFDSDLTDAFNGIVMLSLTGEQTAALITDDTGKFTGVWDVQWTSVDAEVRTLCQGKVECWIDVTRPV